MTYQVSETRCPRCLQMGPPGVPCGICGYPDARPSFTLVYEARSSRPAMSAFRQDAARLAQLGYLPLGEPVWAAGDEESGARTLAKVLLGRAISEIVPPSGYLRVEYRRSDLTPEEATARPDDAIKWGG
jgi:hypothetical protein